MREKKFVDRYRFDLRLVCFSNIVLACRMCAGIFSILLKTFLSKIKFKKERIQLNLLIHERKYLLFIRDNGKHDSEDRAVERKYSINNTNDTK